MTTHSVQVGRWELVDSSEPKVPELTLRPTWTEQQGGGGPTMTAEDTLGHDGWGRVTSARYLKNGGTLLTEEYLFDRDANISLISEMRTYDLVTTRMTASPSGTYSYDRAGNLVTWAAAGGVTWTYGYDALQRLIWVRKDGALMARYAYDVLGRRIVKRVYSGPNAGYGRMIYAGDAVRAEADSAGTLTLAYTWGLGVDNLVAIRRYSDGGHWYVVQDLLRSVRGLSRRDGVWLASWRYGIYGQVLDSAGSAPLSIRYRWTGREFDEETGLYYFRARYYDPASQRFIQEDPIGYAGGLNLYGYADGNPTNARDPSGLGTLPGGSDGARSSCPAIYIDGARTSCKWLGFVFDQMGHGGGGWSGDGGGGSLGSYAELLNCIGNAACQPPPGAVEHVLQRLTLEVNLAWLRNNVSMDGNGLDQWNAHASTSMFVTIFGLAPELMTKREVVFLTPIFPVQPLDGMAFDPVRFPIALPQGSLTWGRLYQFVGSIHIGYLNIPVSGPLFNYPEGTPLYNFTVWPSGGRLPSR